MKLYISIIGILILVISASFGFKYTREVETNTGYHLFKIGRSKDANEIIYDINFDENGKPVNSDPLNIYWVKKTKNNKIEPLTWIQKKFAYGIKILDPGIRNNNEWHFQFVSYAKRTFKLKQTDGNRYKVFTTLNEKEIEVTRIFVQIDGGSFWVPSISYVMLFGIESSTNTKIAEAIIP